MSLTSAVRVEVGDITKIGTDVIVNAANKQLASGGGVCGAIFQAAGHSQLQAACDAIGHCPTGSAVATPSFGLEKIGTHHIIHAVGPRWNPGDAEHCAILLASAYRSSLLLAQELGARTIAFPAISTGIYGFPVDRAAQVVAELLTTELFNLDEIVLLSLQPDQARIYQTALDGAHAERQE